MTRRGPNMQPIPLRTLEGAAVKEAASRSLPLVQMDFAALEVRILAAYPEYFHDLNKEQDK